MDPRDDWLVRLCDAIADLREDDVSLNPIDLAPLAPKTEPAFLRRRPIFAVLLAGAPVGELQVAVRDSGERPVFSIGKLLLRSEVQGRGIARAFHVHLDRVLAGFGFDRINLDTSGAGSYAWTRLGYDFDLQAYRRLRRFRADSLAGLQARIRAELLAGPAPTSGQLARSAGAALSPLLPRIR